METIIITLDNGEKKEYVKGIKLKEVINNVKNKLTDTTVGALYNNKMIDLEDTLTKSGKLSLYDVNTKDGNKIYEKGLLYLFEVSAVEVLGKDTTIIVKHSIDKGVYCKVSKPLDEETLTKIKKQMKEKVKENTPFKKIETTKTEAIAYFNSIKREDKVRTLEYMKTNFVTLYKLGDTYNYIIGDLPFTTGALKYFDLSLIKNKGVVVRFPSIYDNGKVVKYTHHENYFNS